VRAQRPSSVRAGDSAVILGDGTIEGFVGGACAESSVRLQALRVLETGEPVVLRILPGDGEAPTQEGAVTVKNPCLSGGALEIFLEPQLPAPRIALVGNTPVAHALRSLGERLGYEPAAAAEVSECAAVVVASHGRDEEEVLARALRSGVAYVGLVASRRRGSAVVEALREAGVEEHDLARLRTPAGLDIGARTADEIALSILAELVSLRNARTTVPASATDPVCGMEVVAAAPSPSAEHDGHTLWFCGEGCRSAFEADAARHVPAA
jgi:xanthine dehydrogenase accessory factor